MKLQLANYREKWQKLIQDKASSLSDSLLNIANDKVFLAKNKSEEVERVGGLANFVNTLNLSEEGLNEERILKEIAVLSFVGSSGTGKSTRAQDLCHKLNIKYFIDDGLLISETQIIAGTSAKKAKTRFDSIRQAIFADELKATQMRRALVKQAPSTLMIIGTSEGMINKICDRLLLNRPSMVIYIEDVSSEEERKMARYVRQNAGQHIIPVPSMEVKHEFSGSFSSALDVLQSRFEENGNFVPPPPSLRSERTVVRPTFSSLGQYSISDEALQSMCTLILENIEGVHRIQQFFLNKNVAGIYLSLELAIYYGYKAPSVLKEVQKILFVELERFTSINVLNIQVKATRVVKKEG